MIPLRSTDGVTRFPQGSLVLCLFLLALNLVFYFFSDLSFFNFEKFSLGTEFFKAHFVSSLVSPNAFKLFVNLLYFWVFSPKLFEKGRMPVFLVAGFVGVMLARESFYGIHSTYGGPLPALDAFVGVLLGMSLRTEIWATVTTLVVGLGWIRVFEVPSYVLLFFWLFYLFVGNLFLNSPYSEAPMLYWLSFVGLAWGFLVESFLEILNKKNQRPQSE